MAAPTKSQAKARIQQALGVIPALLRTSRSSEDFRRWYRNTEIAIRNTFPNYPKYRDDFEKIRYHSMYATSASDQQTFYHGGLTTASAMLQSMLDEINEYWPDDVPIQDGAEKASPIQPANTKQVFVVHGRDNGTKAMVARVLEQLELEPIILQEQPDQGRTIIEKFEDYAQVGFAVILCTPDDVGALESEQHHLRPRPRQNVVLEWGFFLGKIGRNRVCALTKGDVEIPSDYAGVIYIHLDDAGAWQIRLVGELQSAGFPVDANKLTRTQ